jgi:hypothetical protein
MKKKRKRESKNEERRLESDPEKTGEWESKIKELLGRRR